jgi:hypothetical protein
MTSSQQLPPPQGPEYTPCACSHIEPEHEPNAGDCYSCDCTAYRPAVSSVGQAPATDQTVLRDAVRRALCEADGFGFAWGTDMLEPDEYGEVADAVLAVLPTPTDRAAVLREAADHLGRMDYDTDSTDYGYDTYRDAWNGGVMDGAEKLRRLADEAAVPGRTTDETAGETEFTESVIYEVVGDWGVDSAESAEGARAAVAKWLRAYPKCGAYAQQRVYREYPDGSEYYGPWTDLPAVGGAQQPKDAAAAQVIAYGTMDGRTLLCPDHAPDNTVGTGLLPFEIDDLEDGGICTVCGVDVLIPQQPEADRG